MSDQVSYPIDGDFDKMIKHVYAKPFSVKFKEQIFYVNKLLIDVKGYMHSVQCGLLSCSGPFRHCNSV